MKEFIKKYNIEDYFDGLPEVTKQVLLESNWEQSIWNIAKKHGILLEDTDALVKEIGLILLGVEKPSDLKDNLRHNAAIYQNVDDLIREINIVVFVPMQEKVKELLKHPKRDDLMTAIEDGPDHKPAQPTETVAHKKLSEIFSIPPATSDHSEEMTMPTSYADGEDPYHEPID